MLASLVPTCGLRSLFSPVLIPHRPSALYTKFTRGRCLTYIDTEGQRVISSTGLELKKCTVYDRRNWTCNDSDGSLFTVKDGGRPLISCSKASGFCFLEVSLISRAIIVFRGVDEAERRCNIYSQAFEMFRKMQL